MPVHASILGGIANIGGDILGGLVSTGLDLGRGLLSSEIEKLLGSKSKKRGLAQAPVGPPQRPVTGVPGQRILEDVFAIDIEKPGLEAAIDTAAQIAKKVTGVNGARQQMSFMEGLSEMPATVNGCDTKVWAVDPANNCARPLWQILRDGREPLGHGRFRLRRDRNTGVCELKPVKPRRMDPCNAKALNRAGRRVASFVKMSKRMHASLKKACGPIGKKNDR